MHRYSGCKGNWIPYNYDEIVPRRHQWRDEMRPHVPDTAAAHYRRPPQRGNTQGQPELA